MIKARNFDEALKRINENPDNHGYSQEEYDAIIDLQKKLKETRDIIEEQTRPFREAMAAGFEAMNFSFKLFSQKLEETKFIVHENWFVSFNIVGRLSIKQLLELLYNRENFRFQEYITKLFPEVLDQIFSQIEKTVPHRAEIIKEIKQLYDKKLYTSLIVLVYSQVDGICHENLGYGFFDSDNKSYDLKISELQPGDGLASKIVYQLKGGKNEITRYVKKEIDNKSFKSDSYNRHLVMHGHSIHFGNKLNAMRAISLLDFICSLKNEGVITQKNEGIL